MKEKYCDALVKGCVLLVLFLVLISRFITEYKRRDAFYEWTPKGQVTVSGFVYHKEFKGEEFVYYLEAGKVREGERESGESFVSARQGGKVDDVGGTNLRYMKGLRVMVKSAYEVPLYSYAQFGGDVRFFEYARNEGGYDARAYYEGLGIFCEVDDATGREVVGLLGRCDEENSLSVGCPWWAVITRVTSVVGEALYHFSESIGRVYEYALPGEESGVMSAIALGRRGGLESDVKDILSGAGIIHIIAVSGLHISVVGRGLYRLLRKKVGVGFGVSALCAFIVVFLYALMCGMSVSCIRAVGMFVIFLFAEILGRGYEMGRAAILMAVLILIYNPFFLFSSSFIFSFGAVAGIVLVAGPVSELAKEYVDNWCGNLFLSGRLARLFCDACGKFIPYFLSAVSVSLFTMPVVAWFYYEVPVYSVFLNMLVLPVIGVLLLVGLVVGVGLAGVQLMSGVSMVGGGDIVDVVVASAGDMTVGVSNIGKVLLYPCHVIIYYIEFIADKSALLPGAKFICGRPEWWSIAIYYVVMIFGVRVLKGVVTRGEGKRVSDDGRSARRRKRVTEKECINSGVLKGRIFVCAVSGIFVASFFLMLFSKSLASVYRISFLDVGQGDGIYLTDGRGCDIMVDGGSTSNKQLGKYTILPFLKFNGVREVDYWFVSHCDEDHVSGLKYAANQGYKIKGVYLTENVLKDDGYENLMVVLDEAGVPVLFMGVGDALVTDKFSLKCVFPDEVAATEIGNDANGRSMVLRLEDRYGRSGLFVGDMNEKAEMLMVQRHKAEGGRMGEVEYESVGYDAGVHSNSCTVDFLKVAHHGSKYSSSMDFLSIVRPKIAVISYGRNNYGHPSKGTLDRFDEIGTKVFGTKEMGQITLRSNKKGMFYRGFVW